MSGFFPRKQGLYLQNFQALTKIAVKFELLELKIVIFSTKILLLEGKYVSFPSNEAVYERTLPQLGVL